MARAAAWLWPGGGAGRARLGPDGVQRLDVTVSGRYTPARLVVREGVPARITFLRLEDTPCSAWVVFSAFGLELPLPPYKRVSVTFIPDRPGEYLFTCRMGIYRGTLVVQAKKP